MFLATINKPKQLLYLTFIGQVRVEELVSGKEDVVALLFRARGGGFGFRRHCRTMPNCVAGNNPADEFCSEKVTRTGLFGGLQISPPPIEPEDVRALEQERRPGPAHECVEEERRDRGDGGDDQRDRAEIGNDAGAIRRYWQLDMQLLTVA